MLCARRATAHGRDGEFAARSGSKPRPDLPCGAITALGVDPQRPIVAFVGRITRQKGVAHLVAAAHDFAPDVQLVLCAGAPDTPEIGAEIEAAVGRLSASRPGVHWVREMLPLPRIREILTVLAAVLGDRDYFAGDRPNALDVYAASFLAMLTPLREEDCPRMMPALRQAFAAAPEEIGDAVTPELAAHRRRMLERHLGWPVEI